MKLFISILSWLLHHANRLGRDEHFYAIKNRILKKYSKHICYDVQFIEGKKCHSCGGTGWHYYYDNWGFKNSDSCWNCDNGWYKKPVWNILAKVQFGKYTFHQPYQRSYTKPDNSIQIIEGYIDHAESKYSKFAKTVLFLIYEKGYLKRYYKEVRGWYVSWWLPKTWIHNIIYLIKYGPGMPISRIKRYFKPPQMIKYNPINITDDMPF